VFRGKIIEMPVHGIVRNSSPTDTQAGSLPLFRPGVGSQRYGRAGFTRNDNMPTYFD
jgi:hypothetical protein